MRSSTDKQVILFASLVLSRAGKGNRTALLTNQLTPPSHLHRWALASSVSSLVGMLEQGQDWPTCVSSKATMTQHLLVDILRLKIVATNHFCIGGQTVISALGLMGSRLRDTEYGRHVGDMWLESVSLHHHRQNHGSCFRGVSKTSVGNNLISSNHNNCKSETHARTSSSASEIKTTRQR